MPDDDIMTAVSAALAQGQAGDRAGARLALETLWDRTGTDGDALHRCTIAHCLADLQESVADELAWDQRALAAAGVLTDERAQQQDPRWTVQALLPSLHINLADAYRRSGRFAEARPHLTDAVAATCALPDDEYGATILMGIDKVRAALDAGSTAPLQP
ncbi:hypothetical protein [Symbioplanes lichenis]|uniref:hypothetical protein n=1 Tax=Symbioplanes lichenis TaxID=1629072 RepID=UPI0027391EEB|nr:hypothetical protein [Actinoplanes lichenis]